MLFFVCAGILKGEESKFEKILNVIKESKILAYGRSIEIDEDGNIHFFWVTTSVIYEADRNPELMNYLPEKVRRKMLGWISYFHFWYQKMDKTGKILIHKKEVKDSVDSWGGRWMFKGCQIILPSSSKGNIFLMWRLSHGYQHSSKTGWIILNKNGQKIKEIKGMPVLLNGGMRMDREGNLHVLSHFLYLKPGYTYSVFDSLGENKLKQTFEIEKPVPKYSDIEFLENGKILFAGVLKLLRGKFPNIHYTPIIKYFIIDKTGKIEGDVGIIEKEKKLEEIAFSKIKNVIIEGVKFFKHKTGIFLTVPVEYSVYILKFSKDGKLITSEKSQRKIPLTIKDIPENARPEIKVVLEPLKARKIGSIKKFLILYWIDENGNFYYYSEKVKEDKL